MISEADGLNEINVPDGTFLQFACAANQTSIDDLFFRHLSKNLPEEDVEITEMFNRISKDVNEESKGKQQPLSINGLTKNKQIYLNPLKAMQLDQIKADEMETFLKKQKELQEHYDNFPEIEQILNRNTVEMKKAEEFTESILSTKVSGDVTEKSTACHVIHNLLQQENTECLFFDSKQGMNLHDASRNLNDLTRQDRPFVLKLNTTDGLGKHKWKVQADNHLNLITTLERLIEENQSHPILNDIRERLAEAHQTNKENTSFQSVFVGSINIVYDVLDEKRSDIALLIELPQRLKEKFDQFQSAKMHPLLARPAFDIAMFDDQGNKTFPNLQKRDQVGSPERIQPYRSPAGWTRYGLKVLDKYSDGNQWLHPFGDPRNCYRAFHGTGRASANDLNKSNQPFDRQFASVDALASIHKTGFRKARVTKYGEGVYCSPDPTFCERGYVEEVQMNTLYGQKKYRYMMQVAVNPDGVKIKTKFFASHFAHEKSCAI